MGEDQSKSSLTALLSSQAPPLCRRTARQSSALIGPEELLCHPLNASAIRQQSAKLCEQEASSWNSSDRFDSYFNVGIVFFIKFLILQ